LKTREHAALLKKMDYHENVAVARQRSKRGLVDVTHFGPVFYYEDEFAKARVDACVGFEKVRVVEG
jgi:hypothetical protein